MEYGGSMRGLLQLASRHGSESPCGGPAGVGRPGGQPGCGTVTTAFGYQCRLTGMG